MKTALPVVLVGVGLILGTAAAQDAKTAPKAAAPSADLKDLKSKASYSIGLSMGMNLKAQAIDLDPAIIARGIADGISGAAPALSKQQCDEVMVAFEKELRSRRQPAEELMDPATQAKADKNMKAGQAYLAANKAKPGVITTASGLQYSVTKEGTGPQPTLDDTVVAHYKGTLIDGTEFDSSYKRGQPLSFPLTGVIPGWTEALQLMKVGAKYKLFIPSDLAYGPQDKGDIPPNSSLIFDVELVAIK